MSDIESISQIEFLAQVDPRAALRSLGAVMRKQMCDLSTGLKASSKALALSVAYGKVMSLVAGGAELREVLAAGSLIDEARGDDTVKLLIHPSFCVQSSAMSNPADSIERINQRLDELERTELRSVSPWEVPVSHPMQLVPLVDGVDMGVFMRRLSLIFRRACPDLNYVAPYCAQERDRAERPRVAIVGSLDGVFKAWYGRAVDALRSRFEARLIYREGLPDTRREIEAFRPHAIVYLHAYEPGHWLWFLAHMRLARLQVAMIPHPWSTGVNTIDAVASSALIEPANGQEQYVEKLLAFPSLPCDLTREPFVRFPVRQSGCLIVATCTSTASMSVRLPRDYSTCSTRSCRATLWAS